MKNKTFLDLVSSIDPLQVALYHKIPLVDFSTIGFSELLGSAIKHNYSIENS